MAKKQKILNKIERIKEHQAKIDELLEEIKELLEGEEEPQAQGDGDPPPNPPPKGGDGPGGSGGGG